jgi:hypothetical protein
VDKRSASTDWLAEAHTGQEPARQNEFEAKWRWRDSADQSVGAHSGLYESLTSDPINR